MSEAPTIHIDHVENLHIGGVADDTLAEQFRGVDPAVLTETGLGPTADPAAIEDKIAEQADASANGAEEVLSPEQEAHYADTEKRHRQYDQNAGARRDYLRNMVMHADAARQLTGFRTNDERLPRKPKSVDIKQSRETEKATKSLEKACGVCAVSETCVLKGKLDKWLDYHPYKNKDSEPKNNRLPGRRPGSTLPPGVTETRVDFLEDLDADPMAHCDPRERAEP